VFTVFVVLLFPSFFLLSICDDPKHLVLIAVGSAALLLGALAFSILAVTPRAKMCLAALAHCAAIVIGVMLLFGAPRALIGLLGPSRWPLLASSASIIGGRMAIFGPDHFVMHRWRHGFGHPWRGGLLSTTAPSVWSVADAIALQLFLGFSMQDGNASMPLVLMAFWGSWARSFSLIIRRSPR